MKKVIYILLILISIGLGCIEEPKNEKSSDIVNTPTAVISTTKIPNETVTKINET